MDLGQARRPVVRHRRLIRRGFASVVTKFRWFIVVGWVVAAVASILFLPNISSAANSGALSSFVPNHSAAVATELTSVREFGVPLLSRTVLVQRDPDGFSLLEQGRIAAAAAEFYRDYPSDLSGLVAAVPVLNTGRLLPFARENSTTAVTFLTFGPDVSGGDQIAIAHRYATRYLSPLPAHGSVVGATGVTVGRHEQDDAIIGSLRLVELLAILVVLLVVGFQFRAVLAPLATLFTAGIAYVVTVHVTAWGGEQFGISVPTELEPFIVVLLLGVVTDYSVFFLTGTRHRIKTGEKRLDAVRDAIATNAPWVLAAGLAVTAGTAVLLVARLDIFHALGPGMAVTVLVSLTVSLTLMPAMLAILGRAAYWPGVPRGGQGTTTPPAGPGWRQRLLKGLTVRPVAATVVVVMVAGLGAGAWQLTGASMGLSIIDGLPAGAEARRAAAAAGTGFAPGIVSPTVVLVQGHNVASQRQGLARFERSLSDQPGVAGVLGPALQPTANRFGVFLAPDGNAARYAVVLDAPPLQSPAVQSLSALKQRLPLLLRQAGLHGATAAMAGDTAVASEIVTLTRGDIVRVGLAALIVDLLVLLLFLRAPVASLYLVAADALALLAALGITTVVVTQMLGYPQFTFYVPFATAVLLIAFGSDYNIFLVGRIWDAAEGRSLPDAILTVGPRAAHAISIAGVSLAASFATLAMVPLVPFREFALAMVIGVLLEVFLVRPLLVPALITVFGTAGIWPRRRGGPAGVVRAQSAQHPTTP